MFNFRSCQGIDNIVSCKETFNLFYLKSSKPDETKAAQLDEKTYTKVFLKKINFNFTF